MWEADHIVSEKINVILLFPLSVDDMVITNNDREDVKNLKTS